MVPRHAGMRVPACPCQGAHHAIPFLTSRSQRRCRPAAGRYSPRRHRRLDPADIATTPTPGTIAVAATAALPDFSALAAQVGPAVVSVTVRETPPLERGPHDRSPGGRLQVREARRSGFLIDPSGTIVTNNHVVKDAARVSVTLSDGTELPARIVGRDARTDLAVLQVDAGHALPALQLGDSDQVRPGQWVVAVGNPFGLGGTVTAGIVSARGRDISSGPYDSFLQVDAAINQGNSGGPLFTQDGRVVGVNTAILSPSGGSVGIGFAIPSSLVKGVVGQLRTAGHVTRGFLGVETQTVTAAVAPALGLPPGTHGALVAGIAPDSPAVTAGMQPGDVVRSVDGAPIDGPRELALRVADVKPGRIAHLGLLRGGQAMTLDVTVAAMPEERQAADASQDTAGQPGIGVALAPLSPELRGELELPGSIKGAVVVQVRPGSPAAQAGVQEGDVVVGVGAKPVGSPADAAAAIQGDTEGGRAVALRIVREGQARFIAVPQEKAGASG